MASRRQHLNVGTITSTFKQLLRLGSLSEGPLFTLLPTEAAHNSWKHFVFLTGFVCSTGCTVHTSLYCISDVTGCISKAEIQYIHHDDPCAVEGNKEMVFVLVKLVGFRLQYRKWRRKLRLLFNPCFLFSLHKTFTLYIAFMIYSSDCLFIQKRPLQSQELWGTVLSCICSALPMEEDTVFPF